MMKKIGIICLIGLFGTTAIAGQRTLFVSPRGADRNDGTLRKPFQTVERALLEAAAHPDDTVEIRLRSGVYTVRRTIAVSGYSHLTIAPWNCETVSFTGGSPVSPRYLSRADDPELRARFRPEVRDRIRIIDAQAAKIPLTSLMPKGFGRPSLPGWSELFIDGQPLTIARWPNDTMAPIGRIHCTGDIPREAKYGLGDPVFEYREERPSQWKSAEGMWIGGYFAHGYADDLLPIRSIDTVNHTLTAALPTQYGLMTGAPWRRWFALNLPEEIDRPGEYVIDESRGRIYFLPPDGTGPGEMYISTLESPIFSFTGCRNVTLRGITIEYSRGMGVYIEASDSVRVDSCVIRNIGYVGVCIGRGDNGSDRIDGRSATLSPEGTPGTVGTLSNRLYGDILFDRRAGSHNGVSNSIICHTGAGGVSLGGGDRAALTPAGNYVENCRIYDFNRIEKSYRPGIWIDGVGNRIANCEIFDAPSMAILLHGNDHTVEYCDIHDVCREVDDQGAFYYGRDPSERGNRVRYCYFHNLTSPHRVSATYHDDGACGLEVFGCIYRHAGTIPVLIGGGHDNVYRNNLFIDLPLAVHIDNRMENWGSALLDSGGIVDLRLQTVRYTEPPYATAYPVLADYWTGTPRKPRGNVFTGNLFFRVGRLLNGAVAWADWSNNWITSEDPGFADPDDPIKGFVPDAKIYRMIDRFTPIPFERIGCRLPTAGRIP